MGSGRRHCHKTTAGASGESQRLCLHAILARNLDTVALHLIFHALLSCTEEFKKGYVDLVGHDRYVSRAFGLMLSSIGIILSSCFGSGEMSYKLSRRSFDYSEYPLL